MDRVLPTVTPPATVTDGFGQRITGVDADTGDRVELLEFNREIVEHSGFVAALAERVARFASVRHASYVHLRRLDRPAADRLQLVSDLTPGWRLSELLEESSAAGVPVDITVAIALLRQLLPAVALFGRHNRENAIGALSPQRLIVTKQARLVIAEHAFGPAIEKLNLGREKLWRDFRVTMPPSAGLPRANSRADANAIGVVALTLLLGRSLELDEFPDQLETLVEGAQEHRDGQASPLSVSFKNWLKRALQFDVASAFQTPSEAQLAFESVLASDRSYVTASPAFASWVAEIGGTIDIKRRPQERGPEQKPQAEDAPVIMSSSGVAMESAAADPKPEKQLREVEIALDELVAPQTPQVGVEADPIDEPESAPEPVAEATPEAAPEPEPEAEPETAQAAPRPAFTRAQLEEDPIARELLNYQPKHAAAPPPPEPPPPPAPPPPVRESAPVREQSRELPGVHVAPPAGRDGGGEPAEEVEPELEAVEQVQVEAEPEPAPAPERSWIPTFLRHEPLDRLEPKRFEPPQRSEPPPQEEEPASAGEEQTDEQLRDATEATVDVESEPQPQAVAYDEPAEQEPEAVAYDEPAEQEPEAVAYDEAAEPEPVAYQPDDEPVAPVVASPPRAGLPEEEDEDEDRKSPFGNPIVLGLVGAVVLLLAVTGWLLTRDTADGGMRAGEGELVIQSRPEGAQVKVDGQVKGNTPLTVRLDAGAHVLEVQSGKSPARVIPLMITAGVQTSQYVELQGVEKTGSLEIRTEPAGARITIDGRPRGSTPATVSDLTPGDHTVVLEAGGRKVSQTVRIQAGTTQQLSVPMRR